MAIVTFTKVSNRVTVNNDGQVIGLRGQLNVLPHPNLNTPQNAAIIITQKCNPLTATDGDNDCLVFNVADITVPSFTAGDLNACITALQSIFS